MNLWVGVLNNRQIRFLLDDKGMISSSSAEFRAQQRRQKPDDAQPIFLVKTFEIVHNGPHDIVSWNSNGDAFIVKDQERFSAEVIPAYFKHSKFSSFVRQLNFYGFRKVKNHAGFVKNEENSSEFKHKYFLRGRPDLLSKIKRDVIQDTESISAEVQELRGTVSQLSSQVEELTETVAYLVSVIDGMRGEKRDHASNAAVSDVSRQKSDIDLTGDESERIAMPDRPSETMDLLNELRFSDPRTLDVIYEDTVSGLRASPNRSRNYSISDIRISDEIVGMPSECSFRSTDSTSSSTQRVLNINSKRFRSPQEELLHQNKLHEGRDATTTPNFNVISSAADSSSSSTRCSVMSSAIQLSDLVS